MKVLITAPFSDSGLTTLKEAGLEVDHESWLETGKLYLGDKILNVIKEGGYDIIVVEGDEVKDEVIEGTNLKIIASVRNNPNNISVPTATAKGIPVIAAPGRNTVAVAELTIALMLSQARRIIKAERLLKNDFMIDDFSDFSKMYKMTTGFELQGKTVGIIGLGQIGIEVAKRLNAFGVNLLVTDPYVPSARLEEVGAIAVELEELLRESDIVSIHCPQTEETMGMLGADQFAMMKKTAIIINTARASITDENALKAALETGVIAGAGLDVFSMEPVDCDNEFLELDNVTVTPHIGGNTTDTIEKQSRMIAEDIKALLSGGSPKNILNPEVLDVGGS
ncbi:MAG: 3-phosphoglycerate dehydrogenase [Candidatus Thorarchaeota archaeon]|nr:MAG: 3-phosphoglycerate dehydrogenase [Candidatus Thorarchaeota archaeon]